MIRDWPGGPTVRKLREGRGLTQEELAKKAHIHPSYVAKLEVGARTTVSERVVRQLARALRVDPVIFALTPEAAIGHLAALVLAEQNDEATA